MNYFLELQLQFFYRYFQIDKWILYPSFRSHLIEDVIDLTESHYKDSQLVQTMSGHVIITTENQVSQVNT